MQIRGKIHTPERASQLRDYSGLVFGNITPTDIDGLIEYKNVGYIILELKYDGIPLLQGQRLALERLTDDLSLAGKNTLCIIASHHTEASQPIDAANTAIVSYRHNGKWYRPNSTLPTKELIQRFINYLI